MTSRLTAMGAVLAPDALASVVERFRSASPVRAGLVLPFDRPATADDLTLDPALTTMGVLWSDDAECRWRVEGDRAVVTILADGPSADALVAAVGLDAEQHEVDVEDGDGPVVWVREPFSTGVGARRFVERVYRTATGPVHRRLHLVDGGGGAR
jgi:hypothetical protein